MRAAVYNPYLDTLGGGERYSMAFAKALVELGYAVEVEWKDREIKKKLEDRFGSKLDGVSVVDDIGRGDGYDVCFWVSDGSIPMVRARRNVLHFQVPFRKVGGKTLLNRMKLFRFGSVVCNSYFTKSFIDEEFGVKSSVIYPPVDVDKIKAKRKENLILYVGRFSTLKQSKGQEKLVEAFRFFYDGGNKSFRLVLAGGVEVGVGDFVDGLRKEAEGYPISIVESPSYKKLLEYYGKAKFFWSAGGYGVDEDRRPERVEHFGISVVEAMAAGAVPLVFNAGGHKEIVKEGESGFLWNNIEELVERTASLVADKKEYASISKRCVAESRRFGYERFKEEVKKLLE